MGMAHGTGNILLVGFMGAGKSTVGRLLARHLGLCFVETDDMVTALTGKPIAEIFREKGEDDFRQKEREILDLLVLKQGHVISTGGGLPCDAENLARLKALGTVVWLRGDIATLRDRAARSGRRPLLTNRSHEDVETLYRQREPFYAQAHLIVETDGLGPDEVVHALLRALEKPPVSPGCAVPAKP